MKRQSSSLFWIGSLLFFSSGATGLAYEVIWFKRFAHVWGSSAVALAAVVASFLFGLGLGAQLWGRYVDRVQSPLRWYGICEISIGILAALIPWEIQGLFVLTASLGSVLPDQQLLQFGIRFLATLLVIGPPCMLMGGTLPLLVRHFTRRDGSLSDATGWLYGINTLGAAVGCFASGFYLLSAQGLFWTNMLAASINVLIGVVALYLTRPNAIVRAAREARETREKATAAPRRVGSAATKSQPQTQPQTPPQAQPQTLIGSVPVSRMYMAALISGAAALILQMIWARQLALALGGSTYAFTSVLSIVLVSMAIGSLIFHRWLRERHWTPWAPAGVIVGIAASTVVGKLMLPWLCKWVGYHAADRATSTGNALICMAGSSVVELLPALGMGILFPLLLRLIEQQADSAGRIVGNAYAWNTAGTLPAAALTSLILIPSLGTDGSVGLAIAMYLIVFLLYWPRWVGVQKIAGLALAAIVVELASIAAFYIPSPLALNMGRYQYGPDIDLLAKPEILFFKEGASANVLVTHRGTSVNLRVNGKVDASDGMDDMQTQLGLGYLPRFLSPEARDVLVIGYGSGTTVGVSLEFPDTNVTCCEIEPAIYQASPLFANLNHSPEMQKPRFKPLINDGRSILQGSAQKYDLIISEPSNPWMVGVSNLFTQEFFRVVQSRLNEGGILAQWIQTYRLTKAEYALILRTLKSVFPYSGLVIFTSAGDTILMASNQPIQPTAHGIEKLQTLVNADDRMITELQTYYGTSDLKQLLLLYYQLPDSGISQVIEQSPGDTLNTDINLRLEFDAPLQLFSQTADEQEAVAHQLARFTGDVTWLNALATSIGGVDPALIDFVHALSVARRGEIDPATQLLVEVLKKKPDLATLYKSLAHVRAQVRSFFEAYALATAVVTVDPQDGQALTLKGELAALNPARYQEALNYFRAAVKADPSLVEVANNLAWMLATDRNATTETGKEAIEYAKHACEKTEYKRTPFVDTLATAYATSGDFAEAIRISDQLLEDAIKTGNGEMAGVMRLRLERYQNKQRWVDTSQK